MKQRQDEVLLNITPAVLRSLRADMFDNKLAAHLYSHSAESAWRLVTSHTAGSKRWKDILNAYRGTVDWHLLQEAMKFRTACVTEVNEIMKAEARARLP